MNLLLLTREDRTGENTFAVGGRRAEHIKCVLRASPGGVLKAGLLGGGLGAARLTSVGRGRVELECDDFSTPPPPPSNIVPVISLPRPQSFRKTLHFIASSGIAKAFFIGSDGVEKSYWKSSALEPGAVTDELLLGLEQGGCTRLPVLEFHPSFRTFVGGGELEKLSADGRRIVAHPYGGALPCPGYDARETFVAIGPESGYTEPEVEAFMRAGFQAATLGAYILRVEFALAFICGRLSGRI